MQQIPPPIPWTFVLPDMVQPEITAWELWKKTPPPYNTAVLFEIVLPVIAGSALSGK